MAKARSIQEIREYNRIKMAEWRARNKQRDRENNKRNCKQRYHRNKRTKYLKRMYGISATEYEVLFKQQNGLCAICQREEGFVHFKNGKKTLLAVDHDHETGKVRSLLCKQCNQLLGNACEDIAILQAAIEYLKRHNATPRQSNEKVQQKSADTATLFDNVTD